MNSILSHSLWEIAQLPTELVEEVQGRLSASRTFARAAVRRYGSSYSLLERKDRVLIHPPSALEDLPRAVDRIKRSLKAGEKIFIKGDFDVDGLASAAIVYRGLRRLKRSSELPWTYDGLKVELGNRSEGHGLGRLLSSRLVKDDFDLLITTDCGIKESLEISHLAQFGIDVIVTDHHEPPVEEELPPAYALIDPKRASCSYPNSALSGCGVAYKLMEGLYGELGLPFDREGELSGLLALGTVADVSPLIADGDPENRILVKRGLNRLSANPPTGVAALMEELDMEEGEEISPRDIGFRLAPKLNAANRVGDPKVGFLLLTTENYDRALHLAGTLSAYDGDRYSSQQEVLSQCREKIDKADLSPGQAPLLFISGKGWSPGIIGLVASRLSDRYDTPAVVVTEEDGDCRGSARSVSGVNIVEGLRYCGEFLDRFGGHEMAAGFRLKRDMLDQFRSCLNDWARGEGKAKVDKEAKLLDGELRAEDLGKDLYEELQRMAPFGPGNPRPLFLLEEGDFTDMRRVGKTDAHLKARWVGGGKAVDVIGFNLGKAYDKLSEIRSNGGRIRAVVGLDMDDWQGKRSLQLEVKDFVD